jgi:hypothetical protein
LRDSPGAVLAGAALLLWPALVNGYPLVFSDTGAFLSQGLMPWPPWDKPFVYGPALHLLSLRWTLWGPAAAQGLLLSWLLWRVQGAVLDAAIARPAGHLLLCAGLAALTAAPWFAALLMPDVLAPVLVLAVFLLGFGEGVLGPAERWTVGAVATFAAAAHLAHLPLAAALVLVVWAVRPSARRPALLAALPLLAAVGLLLVTNLAVHGRPTLSPYGSVFALARLVADGPAARTVAARCPEAGWRLCPWAGRLPTDADAFLWRGDGPVWGAATGGPAALVPEARAILWETLRREPFGVLRAGLANAWRQLRRAGLGDTLGPEHLEATVGRMLAEGFPPAERRRFADSLQARGLLPPVAASLRPAQGLVLLLGAAAALAIALPRAGRLSLPGRSLLLSVLVGVVVNAAVTGALSGPHDRYGARIAWLVPMAALLLLAPPGALLRARRN